MLQIQKQLINYNYSSRNEKIKYLVIHDVGEPSSAKNNRDYFSGGDRGASCDFFVDSNNIIQIIDYIKNYSWQVGDGHGKYGITNRNSIGIEMCLEKDYQPSQQTIQNTIDLTKQLMKELNIPIENVVRHYDASRKNCPQSFSKNNWSKWFEFKKQLISSNANVNKPIASNIDGKTGICTGDGVRIRSTKDTSTKNNILRQLNKGDKVKLYRKEGDWYHIYYPEHGGFVSAKYIKIV